MNKDFELLKITRNNILKSVEGLSDAQLATIPSGFNNNILWNLGHIVSSGQKLTYALSGLPMKVSEEFAAPYAKGTDPKLWTSIPNVGEVKEYLSATPVLLEQDYYNGMFRSYRSYATSYGYTITGIEDAIRFCNVHEAVHFGVIMTLKKLVN